MKKICEIPECNKLLDEMFAEWDKIPMRTDVKDLAAQRKRKEIESIYLPKVFETYRKYEAEHPEEFKDEDK